MVNMALQVKKILHFHKSSKKPKQKDRVGVVFSVRLQYMHPSKIVVEEHYNRDKRYVLKDMKVVCKENTRVNRIHQWCIFLCHRNFKGIELYAVKQLIRVIT